MNKLLKVATISKTRGLQGQVKLHINTEYPEERFKSKSILILKSKDKSFNVQVSKFQVVNGSYYVNFVGFDSINEVERLIGSELFVEKENIKLKKGEFFLNDLIGFKVVSIKNNEEIGFLKIIHKFPSQDSFEIELPDGKTFYLPYVDAFVKNIDLENKTIFVDLIEGFY